MNTLIPLSSELIGLNPRLGNKSETELNELIQTISDCGFVWDTTQKMFFNKELAQGIRTAGLDMFTAARFKAHYLRMKAEHDANPEEYHAWGSAMSLYSSLMTKFIFLFVIILLFGWLFLTLKVWALILCTITLVMLTLRYACFYKTRNNFSSDNKICGNRNQAVDPDSKIKMIAEEQIVSIDRIKVDPLMTPPEDKVLLHMMQQAIDGTTPVYRAKIPLSLIKPFATDYKPTHPGFQAVFNSVLQHATSSGIPPMLVYQSGKYFVMSDDYPIYFAAKHLNLESVTCNIIGEFNALNVSSPEGPLPPNAVRSVFGFAT